MLAQRITIVFAVVLVILIDGGSRAHAEGRLRIAEQFGIAFLPLHVIRDQQLIEKHARSRGLPVVTEWSKLSGGASMNDALLSGSIDVGIGGIGPVLADRFSGRSRNTAAGGAQLWPARRKLCCADSCSRSFARDPFRFEDRLGFCLANADRGRAGIRRQLEPRWPWLVHLPQPQRAVHRQGLRRAADRDPHRSCG